VVVVVVVALAAATGARPARGERTAFAGVDVRTDLGTHMWRLSAGLGAGCTSLTVVVDPLGYRGIQHDTEAFVEREVSATGWAVLGGWRVGATRVLGTGYFHQKPFVGVSAPMPRMLGGRLRARFAGEVELTLVSHGSSLPEVWLWQRDEIVRDGLDIGFFLRVEYVRGL
jgi:hypothetical protein